MSKPSGQDLWRLARPKVGLDVTGLGVLTRQRVVAGLAETTGLAATLLQALGKGENLGQTSGQTAPLKISLGTAAVRPPRRVEQPRCGHAQE